MTLADYDEITLVQFFNKLLGFNEQQLQGQKQEWERIQYLEFIIMINNPHIKESSKPRSFADFKNRKSKQPPKKQLTQAEFDKFIKAPTKK